MVTPVDDLAIKAECKYHLYRKTGVDINHIEDPEDIT